ncbi:effector-associated constant component EACC1 [Kribbella swartbergensis]
MLAEDLMVAEVRVGVVEQGSDDARLEELALLLRQELLALDVRAVEPYREGEAPEGSRGGLAAIAGVLSVSLAPGLQVLGTVVSVVRDWLRRSGSGRTVKVTIDGDTIELTGANDAVQQQLVDAFVRKHSETVA